jgi:hypothetical protein
MGFPIARDIAKAGIPVRVWSGRAARPNRSAATVPDSRLTTFHPQLQHLQMRKDKKQLIQNGPRRLFPINAAVSRRNLPGADGTVLATQRQGERQGGGEVGGS